MNKKIKVFVSYQFKGKTKEELFSTIPKIQEAIEKAGHSHYSTIFDSQQFADEKWNGKQIMQKAMNEIDSSNVALFYVDSQPESQGMLVEMGYALAKNKHCILLINSKIGASLFRRLIDTVIEYSTKEEMLKKLEELKFS